MENKLSLLDKKLMQKEPVYGSLISLGHPAVTECMAQVGFDVLWIDMEHTAIDNESLLTNLIAARAGGTPAWVRLRWNDPVLAKPVLDMGADGIIFPYVRTAEEAKAAVAACVYPPDGVRGYGPLRALDYGAITQMEYVTRTYKSCKKIIQLEHVDAVKNLAEIVKVEGIDGFIIGPNDLSGSLGLIGQVKHKKCLEVYEEMCQILRESKIPFGVATFSEPAWLNYWKSLGATVFFCGADWNFLYSAASDMVNSFKTIFRKDQGEQ